LALALLLAVTGCGFEGELPATTKPPSPPVSPNQAAIALSLSPNPIYAVAAEDGDAPWSAEWTLGIRETAGIGGSIDFVRATLADSEGASIGETELDGDQVSQQLGGSSHIKGGSNQTIVMGLNFEFPADVSSADLSVSLQLSDDRGNIVSAAVDDVIQLCVPRLLTPDEGAMLDTDALTANTLGVRLVRLRTRVLPFLT
jgi:hypothetical protein